jgi:LacI family transcriptional regulator
VLLPAPLSPMRGTTSPGSTVKLAPSRARRSGAAALVGFDDFALADKLTPPVSVVTQDPAAMGGAAAELLFSHMAGDNSPPRELILSTRMVARGSGEVPAAAVAAGHRPATG